MKVPPKRKGNRLSAGGEPPPYRSLNESPSEKEGKSQQKSARARYMSPPSMKVPPKRKGNGEVKLCFAVSVHPSMKVPPKRKGNPTGRMFRQRRSSLNESPSEKEGK